MAIRWQHFLMSQSVNWGNLSLRNGSLVELYKVPEETPIAFLSFLLVPYSSALRRIPPTSRVLCRGSHAC